MMSRQKAAQYFIVAWIKDWTLAAYLAALADGGAPVPLERAQALYPWLPGPRRLAKGHQVPVRGYLAESNKPLSDALLDAAGDRARLALAPRVEAFVYTGRFFVPEHRARREAAYGPLRHITAAMLYEDRREAQQRRRGAHWQVCK